MKSTDTKATRIPLILVLLKQLLAHYPQEVFWLIFVIKRENRVSLQPEFHSRGHRVFKVMPESLRAQRERYFKDGLMIDRELELYLPFVSHENETFLARLTINETRLHHRIDDSTKIALSDSLLYRARIAKASVDDLTAFVFAGLEGTIDAEMVLGLVRVVVVGTGFLAGGCHPALEAAEVVG